MAIKLTLGNAKGGVGKTIISNLLSFGLSSQGYKVLLVDIDPQGNTSMINDLKFSLDKDKPYLIDGLIKKDLGSCIQELMDNLFLIAGDERTVELDKLLPAKNKVLYLRKYIEEIEDDFDFIFFDVPPTAYSVFLNNALGASDGFIVLTEAAKQSFDGISKLYNAAVAVQEKFNPSLDFLGVVINRREKDVANFGILEEMFQVSTDDMFFKTMIPSRTRIGKYSEHGIYNFPKSVNSLKGYDKWDVEVKDCINELITELLERIGVEKLAAVKSKIQV